jgi:ankyrin repeat protein
MFSVHAKFRLLITFFFLTAGVVRASAQSEENGRPSRKDSVTALIDKLQDVGDNGVGYSTGMSSTGFIPLGIWEMSMGILGQGRPAASPIMQELIRRGAAAIPGLIAHLNDKRTTAISIIEGFPMVVAYWNEYDYNKQTAKQSPNEVNHESFRGSPRSYTVTVGDLCFVALGQIVNRNFSAVRYQPTAIIVINSPSYSEALRAEVVKEWGKLTPEQHKASLIQDFLHPDSEERLEGASLRLGYYYRKTLDPLVLKQLSPSECDMIAVNNMVRHQLYPTEGARERKAIFDAYVAKHGEVARQGVLLDLFQDLSLHEADDEASLQPAQQGESHARECLVQLFGYPQNVSSRDAPHFAPVDDYQQARFIDTLDYFPDRQIDQAVRRVLQSTANDDLALSCVNYLIGRGADADIRQYVEKRHLKSYVSGSMTQNALLERVGWTPLHLAIEQNQTEWAALLVRRGAKVNARAANGQTPLHVAAAHNSGAIPALLKWKANPNLKDALGRTPVQLAAYHGDARAVAALIAGGGKPTDALSANLTGNPLLVEQFLNRSPLMVNLRTAAGETPLHVAAELGFVAVTRVLLAYGAEVDVYNQYGFTPLHLAVMQGYVDIASDLLAHGAKVDARGINLLTPLHLAVEYSQPAMVTLLLQHHADRHAKTGEGKTPLDLANERNDEKTSSLLKAD